MFILDCDNSIAVFVQVFEHFCDILEGKIIAKIVKLELWGNVRK